MSKKEGAKKVKMKPVKPGTVDVVAISMASIVNDKDRDELVTTNDARINSREPMSTELQNGMVIKVFNGNKPKEAKKADEIEY